MRIDRSTLVTVIREYYRRELLLLSKTITIDGSHAAAAMKFQAAVKEVKNIEEGSRSSSPLDEHQQEQLFTWINSARDRKPEAAGNLESIIDEAKSDLAKIFGKEASESAVYYLIFFREVTARFLSVASVSNVLRTNRSSFGTIFGTKTNEPFEHYVDRSTLLSIFAVSFADAFNSPDLEVLKSLNLANGRILDVGGGAGGLGKALSKLDSFPERYDLFDLPETIAQLESSRKLFFDHIPFRKSLVPGNFFEPDFGNRDLARSSAKYDGIFLTWILHDWDDDKCDQILSGLKPLLADGGKLYVIERPTDSANHPFAAVYEFVMLALAEGVERSLDQYDSLLARNGFVRTNHLRVPGSRDFLCYESTGKILNR